MIQKVKRETGVPVTTGEIWSVWRDHPELVSAVDFIAVHILPYWEDEPVQWLGEMRARCPRLCLGSSIDVSL